VEERRLFGGMEEEGVVVFEADGSALIPHSMGRARERRR